MYKIIKKVKDFNLEHILNCGQCFRWEKEEDGSFTGIAFGKAVNMSFDEKTQTLEIENTDERDFNIIWEPYLDLKRDYGAIKTYLSVRDPIMKDAIGYGDGIRILKQDVWETLISFLISQNNHIPRIKKCIENLSVNFGHSIGEYRGREYFAFPDFQTLSQLTVEDLEVCKLGYRGKYIIETAKAVASDGGAGLAKAQVDHTKEAYSYLTGLCGVGPKVANCIMLFSMAKWEAFPIDVWVRRVMHHLYKIDEKDLASMAAYAEAHFAPWAGIAQQYLFYYIQSKGIVLK